MNRIFLTIIISLFSGSSLVLFSLNKESTSNDWRFNGAHETYKQGIDSNTVWKVLHESRIRNMRLSEWQKTMTSVYLRGIFIFEPDYTYAFYYRLYNNCYLTWKSTFRQWGYSHNISSINVTQVDCTVMDGLLTPMSPNSFWWENVNNTSN